MNTVTSISVRQGAQGTGQSVDYVLGWMPYRPFLLCVGRHGVQLYRLV